MTEHCRAFPISEPGLARFSKSIESHLNYTGAKALIHRPSPQHPFAFILRERAKAILHYQVALSAEDLQRSVFIKIDQYRIYCENSGESFDVQKATYGVGKLLEWAWTVFPQTQRRHKGLLANQMEAKQSAALGVHLLDQAEASFRKDNLLCINLLFQAMELIDRAESILIHEAHWRELRSRKSPGTRLGRKHGGQARAEKYKEEDYKKLKCDALEQLEKRGDRTLNNTAILMAKHIKAEAVRLGLTLPDDVAETILRWRREEKKRKKQLKVLEHI